MILNFIVGTAAELIKLYPVIRLAKEKGYRTRILSTGQGRENFIMQYRDFQLPEDELYYILNSEGDLDRLTKALRWFLRALLVPRQTLREKFLVDATESSYAIVHGDTMSTLMGAWIGKRAGLPVVHVEAGLRSNRLLHPFPEEITRRLVSRLALWHMAPDSTAAENLRRAGVKGHVVSTQGNTLKDAVRACAVNPEKNETPYVLVNVHRFENLNHEKRWKQVIETVCAAATSKRVIFVMHPQTEFKLARDVEARKALMQANVDLRLRMSFSEFLQLLHSADYLISDGGSNQEECSYLGKPCLLMRESTERQEGLNTCCVLSRFDEDIIQRFLENFEDLKGRREVDSAKSPSAIILDALAKVEISPFPS